MLIYLLRYDYSEDVHAAYLSEVKAKQEAENRNSKISPEKRQKEGDKWWVDAVQVVDADNS